MTETALDQVFANALTLPSDEQAQLIQRLPPITPLKPLAQWVAEQGKQPLDYDELRKLGEFFPAEESVDELLEFIQASRRERNTRVLEP